MQIEVVGVKFRHNNNIYSFSPNGIEVKKGDYVLVETEKGNDIGRVVEEEKKIDASTLEDGLKNVLKIATNQEVKKAEENDNIAR